jgi:hypothetical protein
MWRHVRGSCLRHSLVFNEHQQFLHSPILPPGSRLALWPMDFAGEFSSLRRLRKSEIRLIGPFWTGGEFGISTNSFILLASPTGFEPVLSP